MEGKGDNFQLMKAQVDCNTIGSDGKGDSVSQIKHTMGNALKINHWIISSSTLCAVDYLYFFDFAYVSL